MTPERAKELIPILQAVADRKEVEYFDDKTDSWHFASMLDVCIYERRKLRVKPEPEIIPYDNSDNLVGKVVKMKTDPERKFMITGQEKQRIHLGDCSWSYAELFDRFTELDGSPCGKERAE